MSKNITAFVTGGSGYVGRNLIRFLTSKGWKIVALARSSKSRKTVENAGAVAVSGDLDSIDAMAKAMQQYNCTHCFHCAASVEMWDIYDTMLHINKTGSINVAKACIAAGTIKRLIHVSSNAVLTQKNAAMINAKESDIYPKSGTFGMYGATKREAEIEILKYIANHNKNIKNIKNIDKDKNSLEIVVIRPPMIWGSDDTTFVPTIIDLINNGSFAWLDGGMYKLSIAHVLNVCHAMYLMAISNKKDINGEIYFLTDEMDVYFKPFVKDLLKCVIGNSNGKRTKTNKIEVDKLTKSMSYNTLWMIASCLECLLCFSQNKKLNDLCDNCCNIVCCCCGDNCFKCDKHWLVKWCHPPITRVELAEGGRESTVNASKIRKELGFKPIINVKQGLIDLAKLNGKTDKQIEQIKWETV